MPPPGEDPGASRLPDWLVAILVIEGAALAIALITPVTPSKTGSTWSPAHLFTTDPSYFEKFLASFVMVNLIILLFGVAVWVSMKWDRRKKTR